jgi:hypothetical protein
MKNSNKKLNRFLCISGTMALIMLGSLSISGCGGGGGDDDGAVDGTGTTGTIFNQDNTVSAAQLAADTMSFFPAFSEVSQEVITLLAVSDPVNFPLDLAGVCTNAGTAKLSWNDADSSLDLSAGDTVSLLFTNCDIDGIASGTIDIAVTSAELDLQPPNSVAFAASVNLNINDTSGTATFTANFDANWSTPNDSDFINVYTADDASGKKLSVSENGVTLFQFGCFNVTHSFNIGAVAGTYQLIPDGVINAADKIMSLLGDTPLDFINDTMESGIKHLWGVSIPECTTVGVPSTGVSGNDGSYILMEALGGGIIQLRTFDAQNVVFFTENTTWDLLID